MYSTCLFCNTRLGANEVLPGLPVGRRIAFDAHLGRLWVVCLHCGRWNLTPLDERWETVEECERRFRATPLRVSTDNIGLAQLHEGLELVRIGKALRPEIAAWRYGQHLRQRRAGPPANAIERLVRTGARLTTIGTDALLGAIPRLQRGYDALTWLRIYRQRRRVLDVATLDDGRRVTIRFAHLDAAELIRPDRREPWQLSVAYDGGSTMLTGDAGLRTAGKMLAAINGFGGTAAEVQRALAKLEDAGNPEGYFARVAAIAMRTSWGRWPDARLELPAEIRLTSDAERLALQITNRSFWGRGAVGSEPKTALPRLPLVDRLALEMAANEDAERRAMQGELAELEAAWREAEEIAAIADGLFDDPPFVQRTTSWRAMLGGPVLIGGFKRPIRSPIRNPRFSSPGC